MITFTPTIVRKSIVAIALLLGVATVLPAVPAFAACSDVTTGVRAGVDCAQTTDQKSDLGNIIKTVVNVLLFIIGAVAVIMIILGGLKYVLSNGDSSAVTSAKNTILYAVIGLVVALLAYAIVNFVLDSFVAGGSGSQSRTR